MQNIKAKGKIIRAIIVLLSLMPMIFMCFFTVSCRSQEQEREATLTLDNYTTYLTRVCFIAFI